MRYIIFFLVLNFVLCIGVILLDIALASNYNGKATHYSPILDQIDTLLSDRDFEGALREIDTHLEPQGVGHFQVGLAGRKIVCLTQLNREPEAKALLERLIATFPFIRDLQENVYQGEIRPDQYAEAGNYIVEFAQSMDQSLSNPLGLETFLTNWTLSGILKWVVFNLFCMFRFHRWLKRREPEVS